MPPAGTTSLTATAPTSSAATAATHSSASASAWVRAAAVACHQSSARTHPSAASTAAGYADVGVSPTSPPNGRDGQKQCATSAASSGIGRGRAGTPARPRKGMTSWCRSSTRAAANTGGSTGARPARTRAVRNACGSPETTRSRWVSRSTRAEHSPRCPSSAVHRPNVGGCALTSPRPGPRATVAATSSRPCTSTHAPPRPAHVTSPTSDGGGGRGGGPPPGPGPNHWGVARVDGTGGSTGTPLLHANSKSRARLARIGAIGAGNVEQPQHNAGTGRARPLPGCYRSDRETPGPNAWTHANRLRQVAIAQLCGRPRDMFGEGRRLAQRRPRIHDNGHPGDRRPAGGPAGRPAVPPGQALPVRPGGRRRCSTSSPRPFTRCCAAANCVVCGSGGNGGSPAATSRHGSSGRWTPPPDVRRPRGTRRSEPPDRKPRT